MVRLLQKSVLVLLCLTMGACVKTPPKNPEQESSKILALLKELDSFYKEDRFYIARVLYPQQQWTAVWIGINTTGRQFDPTEKNVGEYSQEKLAELKRKHVCTDRYISVLEGRISTGATLNPGMLLTGHEWGDNLSGLMADATFLDYLPSFDAEGSNPVFAENEKLGEKEIDDWHKRRIEVSDENTASYILLYPEIGIAVKERELAFFAIRLKKEVEGWKVDDISIKEDSRKNILAFYNRSRSAYSK